MRRVVQARALSPIESVAGRKGFLRGQLMRDQDTGEYIPNPSSPSQSNGKSVSLSLSLPLYSGGATCTFGAANRVGVQGTIAFGVTVVSSSRHCDQLTRMRLVPSHG